MSLLYAAEATASQASPLSGFIPLILLFAIFYFFLIKPQKKKAAEHAKLVENLQVGDKVITAGGIYGIVDSFKADKQAALYLKIAENTKVLVEKSSISQVLKDSAVEAEIVKK